MPIYEYRCLACGHQFDQLQKVDDPALIDCPECAKPRLEKLVSAPSFQLKGTGWYVTDFRNNEKKSAKDASPESSDVKSTPSDTAKSSTENSAKEPSATKAKATNPGKIEKNEKKSTGKE
jgi:putative FmdB family regulatory protein